MMLFSLVRVLRPRLVVELGFQRGLSAFNFLLALEPDGRLVSFDISPAAEALAKARYSSDPRFRFVCASQADAARELEGDGPIDLIFFDASHDFGPNRQTFEALLPLLAPEAVVAVHDTGSWLVERMTERHLAFAANHPTGDGAWLSEEEYLPWPSERRFVNWIRDRHPEFGMLHLHSRRTLRHGLTLLQRSWPLVVP